MPVPAAPSRARPLLLTVVVFLALDAGRSLVARIAYDKPVEMWRPAPSEFTPLAWPPAAPAAATGGARIYAERCAVCHGAAGEGNGPAAPSLQPRPRDFRRGGFKYKSTRAGDPPAEADLVRTIRDGLQSSAMPYFHDLLSDQEIRAVAAHVLGFSGSRFAADGEALVPPAMPAIASASAGGAGASAPAAPIGDASSAGISHSGAGFVRMGCPSCHGGDGRERRRFPEGGRGSLVWSRDLAAPWSFAGGASAEQIWLRLTTGVGTMPSYADAATPEERMAIAGHVLSLARTPPWEPGGTFLGLGQASPLPRGEYLAQLEMCGLCHTQIDPTGIYRAGEFRLAGGMRVDAYPHGVFISRNLTGHVSTGLGRFTVPEVVRAITDGRTPERGLNPIAMPWIFLHGLSSEDATALATGLKGLPPRVNPPEEVLRYGVVETVLAKLALPLPAAQPLKLSYHEGNFAGVGQRPAAILARILPWAELITLALGFLGVASAGRSRLRGTGATLVAFALVSGIGYGLYQTPVLGFFPPDVVARGALASIVRPPIASPGANTPEHAALLERGRYLYTVASCALCHGGDGRGGLKVSWKAMGTAWTRNLTPDGETGLGAWSDAEIARAIRSGIARGGRPLHWQAMIWDHLSSLEEEDVRALIAYLRALPPIAHAVPAARPPASDDCTTYTFFLESDNFTPGCQ